MKKIRVITLFFVCIMTCSCKQQTIRHNNIDNITESTTKQERKQNNVMWRDNITINARVRYAKDDEEMFRETKGIIKVKENKKMVVILFI